MPLKLLLTNRSTSLLVKRTSFDFMLDFNNDNLKDCLDKNAPTTINNINERFEDWQKKFGIPVIFSKLYTIFWNLLLLTMDDDLYNKHLSEVVNFAHRLSIDENLLQDLCQGVAYVLSGKKLGQNCDLQCKTAEGTKFFLHKITGEEHHFMSDKELKDLWENIYSKAQDPQYFSRKVCEAWLSKLTVLAVDEKELIFGATTDFHRDWVKEKYSSVLEDVVKDVLGFAREIRIETVPK